MLKINLIEQVAKQQEVLNTKNKVSSDFVQKTLYYSEEFPVTKAVATNTGNINASDMMGTQTVFPSDKAGADGEYLIYLMPRFVRGRNVYRLFNTESSKQINNTVKVSNSSLGNYVYQVDQTSTPEQAKEEGETVEVENTERSVERNRANRIKPIQAEETPEQYQERFMKEYQDLVRDINGALSDIDPEQVLKQWQQKQKELEQAELDKKVAQTYETTIARTQEVIDVCANTAPIAENNKSMLFYNFITKSTPANLCQTQQAALVTELLELLYTQFSLEGSQPSKITKDKFGNLKKLIDKRINSANLSTEQLQQLIKDLKEISTATFTVKSTGAIESELRANIFAAIVLNTIGDLDTNDLIEFYTNMSEHMRYLLLVPTSSDQAIEQSIAASLNFDTLFIPPTTEEEKEIQIKRAKEIISIVGNLYKLRNSEKIREAFNIYANNGESNPFGLVAGSFLAPMLGLAHDTSSKLPSYMELDSQKPTIENLTQKIAVLRKYASHQSLTAEEKQVFIDFLNTLSNDENLDTNTRSAIINVIEEFNKEVKHHQSTSAINAIIKKVNNVYGEKSYRAKKSTLQKRNEVPQMLEGIDLEEFSPDELFKSIWLFGTNGPREQYILSYLSKKLTNQMFPECQTDNKSKCEKLRKQVIMFLSSNREKIYEKGTVNSKKGEAFEGMVFLEVLMKLKEKNGVSMDSMVYGGEKGIDAIIKYLRCSSSNTRTVTRSQEDINKKIQELSADKEVSKVLADAGYSAEKSISHNIFKITEYLKNNELSPELETKLLDIFYTTQSVEQIELLDKKPENTEQAAFGKIEDPEEDESPEPSTSPKKPKRPKKPSGELLSVVESAKINDNGELVIQDPPKPNAKGKLETPTPRRIDITNKKDKKKVLTYFKDLKLYIESLSPDEISTNPEIQKELERIGPLIDYFENLLPKEEEEEEEVLASFIFEDNLILKSFTIVSARSKTNDCPSAKIKTISSDGKKMDLVANPESFLFASYSTIGENPESGMYVLGMSKVEGIAGKLSGFGDVSFLKLKGVTLTSEQQSDGRWLNTIKPPEAGKISCSLEVFEAKLTQKDVGINFNSFSRIVGVSSAALESIALMRPEADRDLPLFSDSTLGATVIKARGNNGRIEYSDAEIANNEKNKGMFDKLYFADTDTSTANHIPHQLANLRRDLTLNRQVTTGPNKNALLYFYNGIPRYSAAERRAIVGFPGYVALFHRGAQNKLKTALLEKFKAEDRTKYDELRASDASLTAVIYESAQRMFNAKNHLGQNISTVDDFIASFLPPKIVLSQKSKDAIQAFLDAKNALNPQDQILISDIQQNTSNIIKIFEATSRSDTDTKFEADLTSATNSYAVLLTDTGTERITALGDAFIKMYIQLRKDLDA